MADSAVDKHLSVVDYAVTQSEKDVVPSFRFILRVEGFQDVPLKAIRPFSKENEYEYIQEGGLNDYVHIKRKQATKPFTLVLERYVTQNFIDPLPNGTEMFVPLILFVGNADNSKFDFSPVRTYVFTGCVVMNKEVGGFDAEKSGLLTENITIGYENSYALDTPGKELEAAWEFKAGNIANKYASKHGINIKQNEMRKGTGAEGEKGTFMAEYNNNLWGFEKGKPAGKGKQSATKDKNSSKKKSELETEWANRIWQFGKDSSEVGGNNHINAALDKHSKKKKKELETIWKDGIWKFGKTRSEHKGNDKRHAVKDTISTPGSLQTAREMSIQNVWHFGKDKGEFGGTGKRWGQRDSASLMQGKKRLEDKAEQELWKFGATKEEVKGSGKRHAAEDELSTPKTKKDAIDIADEYTWKFGKTKDDFMGNGVLSAAEDKHSTKRGLQGSKENAKNRMWMFGKTKYDVTGNNKRHADKDTLSSPEGLAAAKKTAEGATWMFGASKDDFMGNGVLSAKEDERSLLPSKQAMLDAANKRAYSFGSARKNAAEDKKSKKGNPSARAFKFGSRTVKNAARDVKSKKANPKARAWSYGSGIKNAAADSASYRGNEKARAFKFGAKKPVNAQTDPASVGKTTGKRNAFKFGGKAVSANTDSKSKPKDKKSAESTAKNNTWKFGNSKKDYKGNGKRSAKQDTLSVRPPDKVETKKFTSKNPGNGYHG